MLGIMVFPDHSVKRVQRLRGNNDFYINNPLHLKAETKKNI